MEDQEEPAKTVMQLFCELNGITAPQAVENDAIALDIEGVTDIMISYLGEGEVEVYAELDGVDIGDASILRLLLEANFLGLATEAARLAIDPIADVVVLSERWDYERLLAEEAAQDLARFAALVASWRSEGVAMLKEKQRDAGNGEPDLMDASILRL